MGKISKKYFHIFFYIITADVYLRLPLKISWDISMTLQSINSFSGKELFLCGMVPCGVSNFWFGTWMAVWRKWLIYLVKSAFSLLRRNLELSIWNSQACQIVTFFRIERKCGSQICSWAAAFCFSSYLSTPDIDTLASIPKTY